MSKNKKVNKKGFTLVELLICVAVMGVLSIYIVDMLSATSVFYRKQTSQAEIQEKTAVVLNTVGDVFKNAKTIAVNDTANELTINSYDSKETRTKILYDKTNKRLYLSYDCDSEDKNIFFSNYLLQDGVTDFKVERADQYTDSNLLAKGNLSTKVTVTIQKNNRTYTESAYASVRNSAAYIGFDVEGGWIALPEEE